MTEISNFVTIKIFNLTHNNKITVSLYTQLLKIK